MLEEALATTGPVLRSTLLPGSPSGMALTIWKSSLLLFFVTFTALHRKEMEQFQNNNKLLHMRLGLVRLSLSCASNKQQTALVYEACLACARSIIRGFVIRSEWNLPTCLPCGCSAAAWMDVFQNTFAIRHLISSIFSIKNVFLVTCESQHCWLGKHSFTSFFIK